MNRTFECEIRNVIVWILHVCHSYYSPFLDCARQYNALFKGTAYKVLTVYLTGEYHSEIAQGTCSDEVIFLGYKSKEVRGLKLAAIARIKEIVKQKDFLFCIAHRVKPTYVALLATKLPIVSVHHNYNDYIRWSRRLLVNHYQNRMLMLGVSNSVRDDMERDLGWGPAKIQTLYNHIDVATMQAVMQSKEEARQALGLPQDAYVIGNVGRLHHDKDQATLIRGFNHALANLPPNSLLYIAGNGPLEQDLRHLIANLGLSSKVILAGNIPDAKRYFRAFNLFALTSDREPFGMVLLEAMAAELPIICSDCGGGVEVVKGQAELFEFGSATALSQAMQKLAKQSNTNTIKQATEKLNTLFSDQAVQQQFWNIEFIKEMQK